MGNTRSNSLEVSTYEVAVIAFVGVESTARQL